MMLKKGRGDDRERRGEGEGNKEKIVCPRDRIARQKPSPLVDLLSDTACNYFGQVFLFLRQLPCVREAVNPMDGEPFFFKRRGR